MSLLKKIFRKQPSEKDPDYQMPEALQQGVPESPDDFFRRIGILKKAGFPPSEYKQKLRYYLSRMPDWLLQEINQRVRKQMYRADVPETLDADLNRQLVSFRLSLYQPAYRQKKDPGLGKIFLILFNLAPELVKNAGKLSSDGDVELASSIELDEIMSDISIFNLSESEMKYTVAKILQYNRQNVAYTDDEIVVLNNSEMLRNLLEQITILLQNFVQRASDWHGYLNPDRIGLRPLYLRMLDLDAQEFFQTEEARFMYRFIQADSVSKLEEQVPRKLRPLFRKDIQLIIGSIRRTIQREHVDLVQSLRSLVASSLIRLHEHNELPSQPVLASLMEKSMQFHRNYYPDLVQAVAPITMGILDVTGNNYRTIHRIARIFEREVAAGMAAHVRERKETPVRYEQFISEIQSLQRQRKKPGTERKTTAAAADYQPEEMAFLKRNPDAELAIIMMNEKLAQAEHNIPLLEDEWFYATRQDFLKVALLETLQAMMSSQAPLKTVRSLLLKSMDRERTNSAPIMEKLITRLRDDGFKWSLVQKLLNKQKKKHHVCSLIKQLLAQDEKWEWFVANDDPVIKLDKFSTVTGLAFFRGKNATGMYKITARFENDTWTITHISPDSR